MIFKLYNLFKLYYFNKNVKNIIKKKKSNKYYNINKVRSIFHFLVLYFKYKKKCSICFEYIKNNNKKLYCNHRFHKKCIDKWLKKNNTCPICRKEIYIKDFNYDISYIFSENELVFIENQTLDYYDYNYIENINNYQWNNYEITTN